MNLTEIRKLIKLIENSSLSELEIEEGELRVRLAKYPINNGAVQVVQPGFPPQIVSPTTAGYPAVPSAVEVSAAPAPVTNHVEVNSPMVGTFYSAPSPEAPPYVKIGDMVTAGQVLCIIEAMKLMNEIEAETAGRIVEIAIENAQPVEFGQGLFKIEPL